MSDKISLSATSTKHIKINYLKSIFRFSAAFALLFSSQLMAQTINEIRLVTKHFGSNNKNVFHLHGAHWSPIKRLPSLMITHYKPASEFNKYVTKWREIRDLPKCKLLYTSATISNSQIRFQVGFDP